MTRGKKAGAKSLDSALVLEAEQPYAVPGNWCWVKLGACLEISSEKVEMFIPNDRYIGLEHMKTGKGIVSSGSPAKLKSTKNVFHKGQLLYGRLRPYLNKHDIATFDGVCSTDILVFNPTPAIDAAFVNYFLDSRRLIAYASANSKGTNLPRISAAALEEIAFPLPPLAEQRRIAERVESLFAKLDGAEAKLQAILNASEQRQSAILHAAFTGKLTEKWRKAHEGLGFSALKEIATCASCWRKKDQRLLATAQASASCRELDGFCWTYCAVGAVGRVTNGSTPSRKVPTYWNGDIPWVSSGEIRNNVISATKEQITQEGYDSTSVQLLPVGTVLIAMIGEGKTRGQSSVLAIPATINQNAAAVIIDHGFVEPRFLWYWFRYSYQRNRQSGSGSGPQALNCQHVRELPFVLPEQTEQRAIVQELDYLFDRERLIADKAHVALAAITTLRQTILAKALHGELGTNDPADPSSLKLLEDILISRGGST